MIVDSIKRSEMLKVLEPATANVNMQEIMNKFIVERGVRQNDITLPKLPLL